MVLIPAFKGVLAVISLVKNFSPIDSLEHRPQHHLGRTRRGVRADCFAARRHHRAGRHRAFQPARTGDGAGNAMKIEQNNPINPRICSPHSTNPRFKKIILLLLLAAACCSPVSGQLQKSLNRDRDRLGLTHAAVLENAPPMLAFTTVALGGFRGLISNVLWMRANDLQDDDKFFEMAQLADWITKLEPHFRPGLALSGLEHGLQHLGQVQGLSRPLALGAARHRTAARRRPALTIRTKC